MAMYEYNDYFRRELLWAIATAFGLGFCLARWVLTKKQSNPCDFEVLECIRHRQSVFPRAWRKNAPPLDEHIIPCLLKAAMWAPFHGRCYKGNQHPAKFVVLGKQSMVDMQHLTLRFYDDNWLTTGWGSGTHGTAEEYQAWRKMTLEEITGRWSPCQAMIAITMRRQAGPKRLPKWEEAAATAAAVQNMHVQSTKFPHLACYWSSWHDAARDSSEMKAFLDMQPEDECLGFFMIAQRAYLTKDRRKREDGVLQIEWRE